MDVHAGGTYFRNARVSAKLTQEEAAKRADISRSNVIRLENGTYVDVVPFEAVVKLSRALNLDIQEVIKAYEI